MHIDPCSSDGRSYINTDMAKFLFLASLPLAECTQ